MNLHVNAETDQVRPIKIMNELDGMRLRRQLMRDQAKPHGVKRGQPLRLRDPLTDRRRRIRIVEYGQGLIFKQIAHVLVDEVEKLLSRQRLNIAEGHALSGTISRDRAIPENEGR